MPGVLGDAGVYFDPEDPDDIAASIRTLMESPELAPLEQERHVGGPLAYSWQRCAEEAFAFLAKVTCDYRSAL